jgi:hypothetical protein
MGHALGMDASHPPNGDTTPPHGPPCPGCARPRTEADARGLAWSSEHTRDGTARWVCPDCTRAQLDEIEAGVPRVRSGLTGAGSGR